MQQDSKHEQEWDVTREGLLRFYACDITAWDVMEPWLRSWLCSYFRYYTGGISEGPEDLAQMTLLKIFLTKTGARYDERRPLRPWVRTIATNVRTDALRGVYRQAKPDPLDSGDPGAPAGLVKRAVAGKSEDASSAAPQRTHHTMPLPARELADPAPDSDVQIADRLAFQECFGALPDVERQILLDNAIMDCSLEQIATERGYSITWVHGKKAEAKRKLDECLQRKGYPSRETGKSSRGRFRKGS